MVDHGVEALRRWVISDVWREKSVFAIFYILVWYSESSVITTKADKYIFGCDATLGGTWKMSVCGFINPYICSGIVSKMQCADITEKANFDSVFSFGFSFRNGWNMVANYKLTVGISIYFDDGDCLSSTIPVTFSTASVAIPHGMIRSMFVDTTLIPPVY